MHSGASIFVNGDASVRITRINYVDGAAILSVFGPGGGTAVYTCATVGLPAATADAGMRR